MPQQNISVGASYRRPWNNNSRRYEKMARNSYDMDENMKKSGSETYDKTKNQSRNSQNRSENNSQNRSKNSSKDSTDNGRNCKR